MKPPLTIARLCLLWAGLTCACFSSAQTEPNAAYSSKAVTLSKRLAGGESLLVGNSDDWDQEDAEDNDQFLSLTDMTPLSAEQRLEEAKQSLLNKLLYSQRTGDDSSFATYQAPKKRVSKYASTNVAYGYYFPQGRNAPNNQTRLFTDVNKNVRNTLGEGLYGAIYAGYADLKRIDASINSVIAQYDLDKNYLKDDPIQGLDDELRAIVTQDGQLFNASMESGGIDQAIEMLSQNQQNNYRQSREQKLNSAIEGRPENTSNDRLFMSLVHGLNAFNIGIFSLFALLLYLASRIFKVLSRQK
jgi:hypothetical protein